MPWVWQDTQVGTTGALPPGSVVIDPAQIAINRTPLVLNQDAGGPIRVSNAGVDWGQALITEYTSDLQRYGSAVIDYRIPNRTVTIPLMLGADDSGSFEGALAALREKVSLLQREGGWLGRSSSSGQNLYADIVDAAVTIPDVYGEAAGLEPNVSLVLTCLPDFYGDLATCDVIHATAGTQALLTQGGSQALIAGDYPGRAQVSITDASGNPQYGLLWAFRSRYYNPASTSALIYPAASTMTPAGGASVHALTGAHGGSAITQTALSPGGTAVAAGRFTNLGVSQVWARCYSTGGAVSAQLAWALGDGGHGLIDGPEVPIPAAGHFFLLNLGQVSMATPPIGNPVLYCLIQAISTSGANFSLDELYLVPLDDSAGYLQGTLAASDPVIPASGAAQLTHSGCWRESQTAGAYTPVGLTFGDLPRIPPSGSEGRPVQMLVRPSRGDLQALSDSSILDAFTVQVSFRPCYLHKL